MLQRKEKKRGEFLTTKISLKAFLFKVLSLLVWVWVSVWNFTYTYMQLLSYWDSEWLGCISFNLLRDFGNFWHICSNFILFSQCRTWFSGIKVVLYVVLVDQKCFVLYYNGFKIVLFVILVDSDASSSASMYFWEVNKLFLKFLNSFFFFCLYFTLCQTSENILLNIFKYIVKYYKIKIFYM